MDAKIRWIKICTDIFDDEKLLLIDSMPDADGIMVIWFKLLCLAGKQNNDGIFTISGKTPYTVPMLAAILRRDEALVSLSLKTFESLHMVEIVDGTVILPNWQKHQNTEHMRKIREDTRQRNIRYRERQKETLKKQKETHDASCDASRDAFVTHPEEDKKKKEEYIRTSSLSAKADEKTSGRADYRHVTDAFNRICRSLPQVQTLSDKRRRAIRAAEKTVEAFGGWDKLFRAVEDSDFLTGRGCSWYGCGFDWILKPQNLVKITEGNYANKSKRKDGFSHDDSIDTGVYL